MLDETKPLSINTPNALGCDAQPCKHTCPFRDQCLIGREA